MLNVSFYFSLNAGEKADWTYGLRDSKLIAKSTCKKLVTLTPQQYEHPVRNFYAMVADISRKLGFTIEQNM